ncbi:hypothetical protein C8R45DRAFT_1066063 [Mycena sanguinolenta]|nr:hypothetical protein C8R45DRAFT_1066063 [Mycena sanguinolenta]
MPSPLNLIISFAVGMPFIMSAVGLVKNGLQIIEFVTSSPGIIPWIIPANLLVMDVVILLPLLRKMVKGYPGESSTAVFVFSALSCGLKGSIFVGWTSISYAVRLSAGLYIHLLEYYAMWQVKSDYLSLMVFAWHNIQIPTSRDASSTGTRYHKDKHTKNSVKEVNKTPVYGRSLLEAICNAPRRPSSPIHVPLSVIQSVFNLASDKYLRANFRLRSSPFFHLSIVHCKTEVAAQATTEETQTTAPKAILVPAAAPSAPLNVGRSQDTAPMTVDTKPDWKPTRPLSFHWARGGCPTRITASTPSTTPSSCVTSVPHSLNASSPEFVPRAPLSAPIVDCNTFQSAPSSTAGCNGSFAARFRRAPPAFWSPGGSAPSSLEVNVPAVVKEDSGRAGSSASIWAPSPWSCSSGGTTKQEVQFRTAAPSFWSPKPIQPIPTRSTTSLKLRVAVYLVGWSTIYLVSPARWHFALQYNFFIASPIVHDLTICTLVSVPYLFCFNVSLASCLITFALDDSSFTVLQFCKMGLASGTRLRYCFTFVEALLGAKLGNGDIENIVGSFKYSEREYRHESADILTRPCQKPFGDHKNRAAVLNSCKLEEAGREDLLDAGTNGSICSESTMERKGVD